MGKETERKFLVTGTGYRKPAEATHYHQGFLSTRKERVVRVRIAGDDAYLTIKGITRGATRKEFEYPIPKDDALEMLEELCEKPAIEKLRYRIPDGEFIWEVDEFLGVNKGLVIAEIELDHEDQDFPRPPWIGREVTGDPKYYNSNLVSNPYTKWDEK